jgi:type IV pilus modification protein PilV
MKYQQTPVSNSRNKGFTLLEIMIAVLIISIGLAALANLQGKLTRYSAMAKQRTLAMNLAEQQIETMHSFYTMGATNAAPCSTAQSGYDDLTACVNGTTVNVSNIEFSLSWAIDEFVQNSDGTTEIFSDESGVLRPDLKLVTIMVEWTDGQGATHHAELVDIVDGTSVFNTGRLLAHVDSNIPPRTLFNPDDFPGVVEIAIGSDKIKGSTTPKPKIVNKGNNVITSFDVVTFLQTGSNAYLQRREEFKVANCICTMDAGVDSGRAPTVWSGKEYALGELVSKRTGSVSSNESGQPAACEMCCNDHHDASGASVKYDTFRPAFSGETGGFNFLGDHDHYRIDNGSKILAAEGDDYLEVCRFIRKDGLFRLTSDLSIQNLDVVKATFPVYSNSDYSTSVVNFVTDFTDLLSLPDYPSSLPDPTYSSNAPGIFLDNSGVVVPAMSRAIYVDYITDDLLKKIKCLKANDTGIYSDYCDLLKDPTWLEIMPFFDVGVTFLANWNRGSSAITVTNSPISDIDSASFSRGKVQLAQDHFDVVTDVTASIELSNSGLTDTNPIDPDDELEASEDIPVWIVIGGSLPAAGALVSGDILAGSNKVNVETVRIRQNPPDMDCEIITIVEGRTSRKAYTCDLSPIPANGSITISDYNALKIAGRNTTVLNRKVCPGGTGFSTVTVIDDGVIADPDLNITGERTVLTFSSLSENVTVPITIEEQADDCP